MLHLPTNTFNALGLPKNCLKFPISLSNDSPASKVLDDGIGDSQSTKKEIIEALRENRTSKRR